MMNEISENNVYLSVVLPIFNEEENIGELYRRLSKSLKLINGEYELIFVNDGSFDDSLHLLLELRKSDGRVKILNFSKNFGHQAAISAGIDYSNGKSIVLMDSDLQDPPEILPDILKEWENGADVVYGVRKKRREHVFKKFSYFAFYRILQVVSNINIPLDSGDFCLLDKKVAEQIKRMPERNRFIRGLRSWVGFNQVAFPYEREIRFAGEVKYTFRKLVRLGLDGIFSFSSFPLRLATYLGFLTSVMGVIYLFFILGFYFVKGTSPQGWTSLIVLFLVISGIQMIVLGMIGEYIARIYDETKQRPNYIVKEFLD